MGNKLAPESEGRVSIVRARLKPLAEIPGEYLCCDFQREGFSNPDEVFVDTEKLRSVPSRCMGCGATFPARPGLAILGEPGEIFIDCYDLDEGETSPAEFLVSA